MQEFCSRSWAIALLVKRFDRNSLCFLQRQRICVADCTDKQAKHLTILVRRFAMYLVC